MGEHNSDKLIEQIPDELRIGIGIGSHGHDAEQPPVFKENPVHRLFGEARRLFQRGCGTPAMWGLDRDQLIILLCEDGLHLWVVKERAPQGGCAELSDAAVNLIDG